MPAATKRKRRSASSRRASRSAKARISIIGAGRLGTTLARALSNIGNAVDLLMTRHITTARRAARLLSEDAKAAAAPRLTSLPQTARKRLRESDLLIIATPDDALPQVARQLATLLAPERDAHRRERVVLHTSGAVSSEVLAPLRASGAAIGSIHPLVAVANPTASLEIFKGAYFCVEGDAKAVRAARSIVKTLRGHAFMIDRKSKALYHAAAVMTAGHVVALFDLAIEMLAACGVTRSKARQILLPLLRSTAANLTTRQPKDALTGPFARGDSATVRRHLASIKDVNVEGALAIYTLLGRRVLLLAPERSAKMIAKLLRSFS